MARIDKEILIDAPVEKIFNYILEPNNWLVFSPSLSGITDVQSLPNGGFSARWTYKMVGVRFHGTVECTDITPNHLLVVETMGGIKSKITWTFRSWEKKTKVTLTNEYKIPVPLLGTIAEAIILNMNEQEADMVMARLQIRFETANH